jgi:hypothetical protein
MLAVPPIRGVREASIDVAPGDTVLSVHITRFFNLYDFQFWGPRDRTSPPQYSSLIHGNVATRGVSNVDECGKAAYFNANAPTTDSPNDETMQTVFSPPDIAGQAIQNPSYGCRKMSCALSIQPVIPAATDYTLRLFRACNQIDAAAFMGGLDMLINEWSFPGSVAPSNLPSIIVNSFEIPVATSFYFRLQNMTNPAAENALMGSLFLHT